MVHAHVGSQYQSQELLFSPSEVSPVQDIQLSEAVVKIPARQYIQYIQHI